MQIIGETIVATGDESYQDYYTPWFPRVADNAVFSYQRIHSSLSSNELVEVYHKNAEDAGSQVTALTATWTQLGTTGVFEAECSNLREMIRFRFRIPASAEGALHYRVLPPTWYTKAVI